MPYSKGATKKKKEDEKTTVTVSPAVTRSSSKRNRTKSTKSSSSSSSSGHSVSLLSVSVLSEPDGHDQNQSRDSTSILNSSSIPKNPPSPENLSSEHSEPDLALSLSDRSIITVHDSDSNSHSANARISGTDNFNSAISSTITNQKREDSVTSDSDDAVSASDTKTKGIFLVERKTGTPRIITPAHTPPRSSIRRKCSQLKGLNDDQDQEQSPPAKRHLPSGGSPDPELSGSLSTEPMTAATTSGTRTVSIADSNEPQHAEFVEPGMEMDSDSCMELGNEQEQLINSLTESLGSSIRPSSLSRSRNSSDISRSSDESESPSAWNLKLKVGFTLTEKYLPHFTYVGHREEQVSTTSKSPEKRYAVSCNHCQVVLASHSSTNANLKRHLTNRHGIWKNSDALSPSDSDLEFGYYSRQHHKQKLYEINCVRFLVLNNLPFQLNRWDAFQILIKDLDPAIRPMSGKTMSRRLENINLKASEDLKLFFSNIPYVSLVVDGWSSKRNKGVIAVQATYTTKEFTWGVKTLALREVVGRHTGSAIRECVNTILQEYDLTLKVTSIVIDNGANMVSAFDTPRTRKGQLKGAFNHDVPRPLGSTHVTYRCAAHTLQLVVKSAALVPGSILKSVTNAMLCITRIMNSHVLRKLLLVQTNRGFPRKSDTRWNAEYDIICILVTDKMFNAVNNIINYATTTKDGSYFKNTESKPVVMTETDYTFLQEYCSILGPLAVAIDILQGDNFSAHVVLPTLINAYQELESIELSEGGLHLRSSILSEYVRRFAPWFSDPSLIAATFLHPWRKMYFFDYMRMLNYDDCLPLMTNVDMVTQIEDFCVSTSCVEFNLDVDELEVRSGSSLSSHSAPIERLHAYGNFDDSGAAVLGVNDENEKSKSSPGYIPKDGFDGIATLEVKAYLMEPLTQQDLSVYWKLNSKRFPMLANLFRSIMSRPATTAPVERLFSRCGIIDHDKRSNISPITLHKILITREWFEQSDEIKLKKAVPSSLDLNRSVSVSSSASEIEELFFDLDAPTVTQSPFPSSSSKELKISSQKKSESEMSQPKNKEQEKAEECMDFESALKLVMEEEFGNDDSNDIGEWEQFESQAQGWFE